MIVLYIILGIAVNVIITVYSGNIYKEKAAMRYLDYNPSNWVYLLFFLIGPLSILIAIAKVAAPVPVEIRIEYTNLKDKVLQFYNKPMMKEEYKKAENNLYEFGETYIFYFFYKK